MQILSDYIPENAFAYCSRLAQDYTFNFILKKDRSTKLGDFRRDSKKQYTITVNRNLNQYQFLLTYIHEFAHLKVAVEHPRSIKAHGAEWKNTFKELMLPLLNPDVFPDPLLRELARHMRNPKAAASSDPKLWKALQNYNGVFDSLTLDDIETGQAFVFKKRVFEKLSKRRTRVLCQEVKSGRKYLIPAIAEVERV